MRRYRYRTPALAGPWRDSPDKAVADAVRARQASLGGPDGVLWVVPGEIEVEQKKKGQPAAARPGAAR